VRYARYRRHYPLSIEQRLARNLEMREAIRRKATADNADATASSSVAPGVSPVDQALQSPSQPALFS
jgi:hypothetical protein